jgi:hypothetical protein
MCARISVWISLWLVAAALTMAGQSQQIQGTYMDLTLAGNWQNAKQYAASQSGADIYYDAGTGALLLIRQQASLQRVGDIAKYFDAPKGATTEAASVMSEAEFPLPLAYTQRISKDLGSGTKPPKMWEIKDGEGNPLWFYASQLFDEYRARDRGGSSEVSEEFEPVHVNKAEQRSVSGGDELLFEVETDRPANDTALRRFHMPAAFKDQRVRYGWVQFAPGGIGSGQGVLSVAFGTPANSKLTIDQVATGLSTAKIKPL